MGRKCRAPLGNEKKDGRRAAASSYAARWRTFHDSSRADPHPAEILERSDVARCLVRARTLLRDERGRGPRAWTPVGPSGSTGDALAVDATNPDVVYAVVDHDVFKSVDGATTWARADTGIATDVRAPIVIDPTLPSRLYVAAGHSGVYATNDAAGSWSATNAGLPVGSAVAVDPAVPTTVYASVDATAIAPVGLYKSVDGGGSWNPTGLTTSARGLRDGTRVPHDAGSEGRRTGTAAGRAGLPGGRILDEPRELCDPFRSQRAVGPPPPDVRAGRPANAIGCTDGPRLVGCGATGFRRESPPHAPLDPSFSRSPAVARVPGWPSPDQNRHMVMQKQAYGRGRR